MKKIFFLAVMAIIVALPLSSQPFQKGTSVVNLGIGIGSAWSSLGNGRPAINLSFEHGLWDAGPGVISIGGFAENVGYKYQSVGYSQKWNFTVVGVRSAYHYNGFTNVPQLDPYGGLMLGYNIVSYSSTGNYPDASNYGSGMGFAFFVGSRWFFTNNLGAFAEIGYGSTVLKAGLALKF